MRDVILAERRWEASRPRSYEFTIEVQCFCAGIAATPPRYEVTGTAPRLLSTPASTYDQTYRHFDTVEKLFVAIRQSIKRGEHKVAVSYDPVLGYPQVADLDPLAKTIDDELFFRVIDFRKKESGWR